MTYRRRWATDSTDNATRGQPLSALSVGGPRIQEQESPRGATKWNQARVDELVSTTLAELGPAESPEVAKVVGDFRHFLSLAIHHHDIGAIESACRAVKRAVAYHRGGKP